MKKLTLSAVTVLMLSGFAPIEMNATTKSDTISVILKNPVESVESEVLLLRLSEINAMDKSGLNSSEKKKLRKETRSIKKTLAANNGGVYLSVGAIIIIVLLLILLL
ncbi:MAG: hypothetical protein IPM98_12920 [Lewinellaceae bacterium]|nr:hypothetical protein [Lewinellaceae bacterium]